MKKITFEEAEQRLLDGKIVFTVIDGEQDEDVEILRGAIDRFTEEYFTDYEAGKIEFGFDDEAETKAEEIMDSLDGTVKDYLYRLLILEGPLFL